MSDRAGADAADRARTLAQLGRPHEAIPLIRQAIAADPHNAGNHCVLSYAQLVAGDLPASEAAAREAIAQDPEEEWGYRLLSLSLLRQGQPKDALSPALVCRQLAPGEPSACVTLVHIALALRETGLAHKAAADLLAIAPEKSISHSTDGDVRLALKQNEVAVARFLEAIRIDPLDATAHNQLGVALLRCGDRAGALRAFQTSAELDPTDLTPTRNIRMMAREDRLPLPRWARVHPLVYGPAFLVALVERGVRRQHYSQLPATARRDIMRWTLRDGVIVMLAVVSGLASLTWLVSLTGLDPIAALRDPALAIAVVSGLSRWLLRRFWR